jgi:hypothetical protein
MESLVARFQRMISPMPFKNTKRPPGLEFRSINAFMFNFPFHLNSGFGAEG